MFGYVKPFQPELQVKELDAYKAVYCGLCGQLGRSYGPLARFTLSYDFTFLSMLHYAVSGEHPSMERRRCYVNPAKKLPVCSGGAPLELGADVASIMIYYKLLDNIRDSNGFAKIPWQLLRPLVGNAHKKSAAARPKCEALVARSIREQNALEAALSPSADAACEPTATALGGIFSLLSGEDNQQRVLERLGYLMGRFIYLCDALDDMEEDARNGGYNPYVLRFGLRGAAAGTDWELARQTAVDSLLMTIGEVEKTAVLLQLHDFAPIIDNIITLGLRASVDEILAKKENSK